MNQTAANLRPVSVPPAAAERHPGAAQTAIRIRDLRKSFGALTAIDGVSLDIGRGSFS